MGWKPPGYPKVQGELTVPWWQALILSLIAEEESFVHGLHLIYYRKFRGKKYFTRVKSLCELRR